MCAGICYLAWRAFIAACLNVSMEACKTLLFACVQVDIAARVHEQSSTSQAVCVPITNTSPRVPQNHDEVLSVPVPSAALHAGCSTLGERPYGCQGAGEVAT